MLKLEKKVLKMFMVMLVIVALVVPTNVFAAEEDDSYEIITPGETTTPSPEPTVKPTATSTPKVTTTPTSATKLPQTGIEDYTGLIVVAVVLGASAIFAYKKIRDYDKF